MRADTVTSTGTQPWLKRTLRPLVPQRLLTERDIISRLGAPAGRIYLKLRLLDATGMRWLNKGKVPATARSFVFVCHGNIMRSPMAELMLKRAAVQHGIDDLVVMSAGIHASPGREAHPWAQLAAQELGMPLSQHCSKLLTAEMVAQADVIFAMDFQNKAELLARYPDARVQSLSAERLCRDTVRFPIPILAPRTKLVAVTLFSRPS